MPLPAMLSRRAALGLGATVALSAYQAASPQAAVAILDPRNPDDLLTMYRKLQYRTDSGLGFWWLRGPYFALIGSTLTPLYGLNMGTIQRITQQQDGGFIVEEIEMAFHTDLESGKLLSEFKNPITGETVPVGFVPLGPRTMRFNRHNIQVAVSNLPGTRAEVIDYPAQPLIQGDDIYFRWRTRTLAMAPGMADRVFNDIGTLSGPLREVLDPTVTSVKAKVQSTDISDWQKWLKMGDRPGTMTLRAIGGKVDRFDALPDDWRAMLQEKAPEIAADPLASLDRPAAPSIN